MSTTVNKELIIERFHKAMDKCEIYGNHEDRVNLEYDIDLCLEAKAEIREILEKAPGYNGHLKVVLPISDNREISARGVADFRYYLQDLARRLLEKATVNGMTEIEIDDKRSNVRRYLAAARHTMLDFKEIIFKGKDANEWKDILDDLEEMKEKFYEFPERNYDYVTPESAAEYDKIRDLSTLVYEYCAQTVEDDKFISEIGKLFPTIRVSKGMKTSRLVQKCIKTSSLWEIITKDREMESEWNRRYAKYSDAINPLDIPRWFVISIDPVDYFTTCHGKSWTSCMNTDKRRKFTAGDYSSGFNSRRILDYMCDPSTIVCYTVDGKYDGDEFELQPKITRQLFHWGEGKLIQSRLYPQGDESRRQTYTLYRSIVEKAIADGLGEANLWTSPTRGLIYPDGDIFKVGYKYESNADYIDFSRYASHGGDENDFQDEVNYVVFKGDYGNQNTGEPMIIGVPTARPICQNGEFYEDFTDNPGYTRSIY